MRERILYALGALLLAATLGASGAALAAPAAQQALACDGSEGVYLYEHRNFGGRCLRFTADAPDLSAFNFNNAASSIRVVGNYTGVLYVDQNYSNLASAYSVDSGNLDGSVVDEDRASAIRVIRGYRQSGDETCRGDGVYLYEGTRYTGRCVRYTGDESDLADQVFNNQASSVRIVGGYTARLYVDQNYGGAEVLLSQSIEDLNSTAVGNDRASSIRVGGSGGANACNGDGVYLYEHPNYQGRCLRLTGGAGDLRVFGFDDTASSVRFVGGGWSATLFRDLNGTGASSGFVADDPNLADNAIGDNQATSVAVTRGGAPPPVPSGNACDGAEGVYLYEHPNYQGRCARFTANAADLRVFGMDDTASSIRIVGSWTAALFRDLSFTGGGSTFIGNDPNLADDLIGDNQATSISVTRGIPAPQPPPSANACDGAEGVYLYEHPNYQGRCLRLTGGAGDLRVFGFDDIASSMRLVGSWDTTLFRDLTGSGASSRFTASDPNLADDAIGDNQATSIAVARAGTVPPPGGGATGACDGSEGVYLYDGTNYQGACVRLTGSVADLRSTGLNDAVSSVRVFGRWTVVLSRDLNYQGVSSTFVESDPDLRNDGVGSNEATSVQVIRR
jgi:hypothetical protein